MSRDGLIAFNRRLLPASSGIEPFMWEALYKNPKGRLKQFDSDGPHKSTEIDRARLECVILWGHPDSPIRINTIPTLGVPDEVVIGARVMLSEERGMTPWRGRIVQEVGKMDKRAFVFCRYRYGSDTYTTEIAPDDTIWKVLEENGIETYRDKL